MIDIRDRSISARDRATTIRGPLTAVIDALIDGSGLGVDPRDATRLGTALRSHMPASDAMVEVAARAMHHGMGALSQSYYRWELSGGPFAALASEVVGWTAGKWPNTLRLGHDRFWAWPLEAGAGVRLDRTGHP